MYRYYTIPGTIKQGYLIKSPPLEKRGLKGWKKRWCMFTQADGEEPCLNYYHTEEEAFSSLPIKRVSLKNCCKVEIDLNHNNYKNIFAIYLPERVYYFSAASQTEMCEWADTLCSHLNLTRNDLTSPTDLRRNKSSTLPVDMGSLYSPSPTLRPLPKPPNSPLPRTPTSSLPRSPNSPLPKTPNSPLPPIPHEASHSAPSAVPLYSSHSPKHHRHANSPPAGRYGNTMPASVDRYSSSSPSPPVPARSPHTFPISGSPLLSSHHPHSPQGPSVPPRHSPVEMCGKFQGRVSPAPLDRLDFRPPAPPPKTIEHDEFDLEDDPPTPPPRRANFSPNRVQMSSSDSDEDSQPPLPPRLEVSSHNGVSP